jgi:hypothetical protein
MIQVMSERRSYFRIDESIAIEFKEVDEITANTAAAELQFPNTTSLKLFAELRKIDHDNAHLFHQIKETSRALGEYLYNLNRKIDIISQQLMTDSKPLPPSKTIKQVNLSEGGIAPCRSQLTYCFAPYLFTEQCRFGTLCQNYSL